MIYLIYITAFILGIILGWYLKKCPAEIIEGKPVKLKEMIRVLHKAEPISYDKKRADAIKKGKPIIKTFHK